MKLAPFIQHSSSQTGISVELLAAVIHQESGGNPFAVRYEPAFLKRYLEDKTKKTIGGHVPTRCSWQTEVQMRSTSFGLMQLMGQVARERGFQGEFLTELCDPAVNLKWGSELLQTLLHKHDTTEKALLRWNGGGDPNYGKKVLGHIDSGAYHYLLVG
jgi:soluble lytic murein transglycosylase-like protein